jgi:DNA-binding response OmpR family regulator
MLRGVLDQAMPTARVLVVEDEPLIRIIVAEALSDVGFCVAEAATAAAAMSQLRDGGHFDAAIIDVGLPDRRGDALAEEIRATWPELGIVIASGRGGTQLSNRFSADARVLILAKPYSNEAMCDALAMLGVRPSPPG